MKNVNSKSEQNCCGCGGCVQVCPKQCIKMVYNERGFLMPAVDSLKCIDCGLCLRKCPFDTKCEVNQPITSYAVLNNNKEVLNKSTSGGAFYELAKYVLDNNGVVFGCSWDDGLLPNHIQVNNESDLIKIMQSKYVQSNTKDTFKETREYLENNVMVLYSGTGCQIAGFLNYLGKDYENLCTVEVACHGVPAPGLFTKYKKWLEDMENDEIETFRFRNKEKHKTGEHYMFYVKYKNKGEKYYYSNMDPFYDSFLSGKTLRKSCYECLYKGNDRVSDFTLADYWGIEKNHKSFPARNGVSAVIINTKKAESIFNKIKDNFTYLETDVCDVYEYNKSLVESSKDRSIHYDLSDADVIEKMIPSFSIKKFIKNKIPDGVKYVLKRLK